MLRRGYARPARYDRAPSRPQPKGAYQTAVRDQSPLPEDADEWIAADTSPEGSVLAHADADMLADCIRALPREDRDVFLRKYYKEETVAEIARAYGKKPKDIENRLYRIRKTMRNILIERYGKENVL